MSVADWPASFYTGFTRLNPPFALEQFSWQLSIVRWSVADS